MNLSTTFLQYFSKINDPRKENRNKRHQLSDILIITILGAICGADNWVELCEFAEAKEEWLKKFLLLPNGIPSHDTFGRVFSLIEPKEFEHCFSTWITSLCVDVQNEIIAIDGKTLSRST
jgi:hypothetical protein